MPFFISLLWQSHLICADICTNPILAFWNCWESAAPQLKLRRKGFASSRFRLNSFCWPSRASRQQLRTGNVCILYAKCKQSNTQPSRRLNSNKICQNQFVCIPDFYNIPLYLIYFVLIYVIIQTKTLAFLKFQYNVHTFLRCHQKLHRHYYFSQNTIIECIGYFLKGYTY